MKKLFRYLALWGIMTLSNPAVFAISKNIGSVSAYSVSSLPTTIDLNATSAANIRSYYSSLNSLATSQRQGTNLLKNLKTILKNGQNYYSYENGTSIWQMYEITDRDWDKSPASSTKYGTYSSETNKITNYTYGTSSSSSKNNPYIHALYINRNVDNQTTAWDDHNQDEWGINREHVWPKAEGFDTNGAGGARGDPMHLMAGNGYANNIHSNYYYGYVNTSSTYTDCGTKYSNQTGNLRGYSKTLGGTTNVFEPQDCDKGDIARAIFYMVARYNYLSGSDSDGISADNPNLTLTRSLSDWESSGYTSTTSKTGKMGILTDLLNWHHSDPVDDYEIRRNNLLYTNFTNNRNPFIDFPEWVDFIWGKATYSGKTYQSYSSTPTGYATPSSDAINGYNSSGSTVSVTGVTLNTNSISIEVGATETLEAAVAPTNATNQTVTWTSSNESIATVTGGTVRGVAEGSTTITVTTADGGYTATCAVTVTAASGGGTSGTKSIIYSDTFSPTFPTDASSVNTSSTSHTDSTANLTFKERGIYKGKSSSYMMFVQDKGFLYNTEDLGTIDKVSVTYSSGTSTAGKVGVYFGNSEQNTYTTTSNATIKGQSQTDEFTNSSSGKGYFQVSTSYKNVQITQIDIVYHTSSESTKTLESISLDTSDARTSFEVGDTFSFGGTVTATFNDASTEDVTSSASFSGYNMSSAGVQTVTVSYGGKSTTYQITVVAASTETTTTSSGSVTASGGAMSGWTAERTGSQYSDGSVKFNATGVYIYRLNIFSGETSNRMTRLDVTINAKVNVASGATPGETNSYRVDALDSSNNSLAYEQKTGGDVFTTEYSNVTFTMSSNLNGCTGIKVLFANKSDGNWGVMSISWTATYVTGGTLSSITATTNKTFAPGETISKSDIVVRTNLGDVISAANYTFADNGYMFTYNDAPSGGTAGTKQFAISYSTYQTVLTVSVSRNEYESPVVLLTGSQFSVAGISSSYTEGQTATIDGISFTIDGYIYENKLSLSKSKTSAPGKVVNTTPYSLGITNVVVNGATPDIQLSTNGSTWVDLESADTSSTTYYYFKLYYKNTTQTAYVNITSIEISLHDSATTVSNYLMFEDTTNQCESKFETASAYFDNMSSEQRAIFMTSDDYVYSTARARFEAWAAHEGKEIVYENSDYVVKAVKPNVPSIITQNDENNVIPFVIIVSILGLSTIGGYFLIRRKRHQ